MNYKLSIFAFFLCLALFSPFLEVAEAATSGSASVSVSLRIEAYVKSTIENGIMTVMTNSPQPVVILENGEAMPEKAVFGELLKIQMKENSSYTIASEF